MTNTPNWNGYCEKFLEHFGYICNIPSSMDIFSQIDFEKFSGLIDKSIHDNFDYTIAEFGTRPFKGNGIPNIIVD